MSWFSRGFGLLLLCLSLYPHSVQAQWPAGGRDFTNWYVCITFRSESASNEWSRPLCEEMTWFNSVISDVYRVETQCADPGCQEWVRMYVMPAIGVTAFTLSCDVGSSHLNTASNTTISFTELSTHLSRAGPSSTSKPVGSYVYTGTHISGVDLWTNQEHDVVFYWDFVDHFTPLELALQLSAVTSQPSSGALVAADCVILDWDGEWDVSPTLTPTATAVDPTATPSPVWTPTPGGFPTPITFPTPVPTPVPVPTWDVDIGYTPTVTDTTCYVFIPAVPLTTTQWLDLFNIPVPTYDDVGVCVEPFEMAMIVGPWNIGRLAWLLVAVALVVGVWRMFDS